MDAKYSRNCRNSALLRLKPDQREWPADLFRSHLGVLFSGGELGSPVSKSSLGECLAITDRTLRERRLTFCQPADPRTPSARVLTDRPQLLSLIRGTLSSAHRSTWLKLCPSFLTGDYVDAPRGVFALPFAHLLPQHCYFFAADALPPNVSTVSANRSAYASAGTRTQPDENRNIQRRREKRTKARVAMVSPPIFPACR